MTKLAGCWAVVCTAAVLLAGCGGNDNVEVYPVSGQVNYLGKPMKGGGSIAFIPTAGQKGKTAGGTINEDGTYTLTTYEEGDGSMPGEFRVLITQQTAVEPPMSEDGAAPSTVQTVVDEADRIPDIYMDQQGSPLKATVKPEAQTINFELERQ